MLDQILIIIGIVIGGTLSFLGGWIQSSRNRKWFFEDLKRERKFAAIEIRLKQAEENTEFISSHILHAWLIARAATKVRTHEDLNGLIEKHKIFEDQFIYSVVDKTLMSTMMTTLSLGEKKLETAWKNMVSKSEEVLLFKNTIYFRVAKNLDYFSDSEVIDFKNQMKDMQKKFLKAGKEFYEEINILREKME